jgi:hypothetical protein
MTLALYAVLGLAVAWAIVHFASGLQAVRIRNIPSRGRTTLRLSSLTRENFSDGVLMPREAPRPLHLTTNITSERMSPIDRVSQTQLAALITYLYDKACALCRVIYHSHRAANHFFYEADEDIPLDERIP